MHPLIGPRRDAGWSCPPTHLTGALAGEGGNVLQCPACGSGWIVVGLPLRGTLSCVSCHNQWARPALPRRTPEEWYDRNLGVPTKPATPAATTRPR